MSPRKKKDSSDRSLNFRKKGEPKPEKSSRSSGETDETRWWMAPKEQQAAAVTNALAVMNRAQQSRVSQIVTNTRLYGGTPQASAAGFAYARYFAASAGSGHSLSYNLTQSVCDTATAKVCRNKPKPYHLTNGGDFKQMRKAKKLNGFVEGIFYEQRVYQKRRLAMRDASATGDGLLYVHERNGRVAVDRVMSSELWIDEVEAFYGFPRQMHRVTDVDRMKLLAECAGWPEAERAAAEKIVKDADRSKDTANGLNLADVVQVRESWHLPSGPDADDGLHVVSLDSGVLLAEEWTHDFFPFARWSWSPRIFGYWSQGAAEQLSSIHLQLNELLRSIQRAYRLSAYQIWLVANGSKVSKQAINNEIGHIITYNGEKPETAVTAVLPPEVYAEVQRLIQSGYDQVGVSQLNAQGKKPDGLNSGKALREMDDIGSDRFTVIVDNDTDAILEVGHLCIVVARDIAEANGGTYSVKVPGSKFLREIDWKDISFEDDQFVMQCYPVSSLPQDPAGRLQTIQEYTEAGFIPPDVAQKLLEFPDLAQFESLQNAMEDRLQEIFDGIVDDGEYTAPEPYYNLERAKQLCLQYLVRGESQKLEPERIEMLQRFNDQLDTFAQQAQQAAMMNSMPPPGAPAQPLPPPSSDLLPNGAQAAA